MSKYVLLQNVTAAQTLPIPSESASIGDARNLPTGSNVADLSIGGALTPYAPPINQAFHAIVIGNSPGVTVSATVQPLASNDGVHWFAYGTAITIASGTSPGQGNQVNSNSPFAYYSGQVTAISGAGAKVTLIMNA